MYEILLKSHSGLRWLVILFGFITIIRALRGLNLKKWNSADGLWSTLWIISLDIQLVIGLILYLFLSPITQSAFNDFGSAMGKSNMRFFAVEHILIMLIAIVLAHIGKIRVAKTGSPYKKHKRAVVFYTISLVLILISIPWPFFGYGRPLF